MKSKNMMIKRAIAVMTLIVAVLVCVFIYLNGTEADKKKLSDYKNFDIETKMNEITDNDVEETIKATVDSAGGMWVDAENDEEIKDGYIVNVEYYEGGNKDFSQTMEVNLNEPVYPEEFATAIGTMKVGETKDVTLSEEYDNQVFTLNILSAKKPSYDITDEFVEGLGIENVATVDELKENIREYLAEQYAEIYKEELREEIRTKVISNSQSYTEAPTTLVDAVSKDMKDELDSLKEYYNSQLQEDEEEATLDDVLKPYMEKTSFEGTAEEYIDIDTKRRVNECLVFEQIAKKENITLDDSELYGYISKKLKAQRGKNATFDDVQEYIESIGKDNALVMCLKDKVLDELVTYYTEEKM